MTLETADVTHDIYVVEESGKQQSAKSQFADEYDVPYDECNASLIHNSGGRDHQSRSKYPALVVVVHTESFEKP